jgi:hypothetical protein
VNVLVSLLLDAVAVVVVVVVAVVFVFVFAAAVYTNLRLSASKPISMCTEKIRLFATVYSSVFV